jgi:hypothetical protein
MLCLRLGAANATRTAHERGDYREHGDRRAFVNSGLELRVLNCKPGSAGQWDGLRFGLLGEGAVVARVCVCVCVCLEISGKVRRA